jgi:heterotetrameric sarcosine oxidase beta subunit
MAGCRAESRIRCRHRRRRRPRPGHRLLSRKEHGITNVAVIDKGWLGGGNTGRNTTIIRSNYLYDESARLYDHALKLWEGLSQELNYNVMFSQRGVMMLAHSVHDVQSFKRHVHANRLNGVDNEWLTPEQAKAFCPPLNIDKNARYPVMGAALQRRGGVARHDAVAWGYARRGGARRRHHPELRGDRHPPRRRGGQGHRCRDAAGFIRARRSASSAAGHTSVVMDMAGVRLPLESYPLQALVSEPVKPVFPLRRHVEHGARLYQPVRQGRTGDRRGHRPVCLLFASAAACTLIEHTVERSANCSRSSRPHAHAAQMGRHRRRHAGPLADHRPRRR